MSSWFVFYFDLCTVIFCFYPFLLCLFSNSSSSVLNCSFINIISPSLSSIIYYSVKFSIFRNKAKSIMLNSPNISVLTSSPKNTKCVCYKERNLQIFNW